MSPVEDLVPDALQSYRLAHAVRRERDHTPYARGRISVTWRTALGSYGSARVVDVESPEALAPDKADLLVNAERRPL